MPRRPLSAAEPSRSPAPGLVVASLSARVLAEAAARDGYRVIALDLFGDIDTRRAATAWHHIGTAGAMRIEPTRLLDALRSASAQIGGDVVGWIPGSGFEAQPSLIEAGADVLPLLGTAPGDVRRVRDPRRFFGVLAAHGIGHPATQREAPADPDGWLSKDADGCGGWHIRPAANAPEPHAAPSRYFQRRAPGMPMSATFIANGRDARVLGFNELAVQPVARRPMVYSGCIGPVPLAAAVAREVTRAVEALTAAFALRGWCSLDFLRDGADIAILEVNPRPPASLALYGPSGLIDAQRAACLGAALPPLGTLVPAQTVGSRTVFARRALRLDTAGADRLERWQRAHDLPRAGACFEAGDPICSVAACGDDRETVHALLAARHDAVLAQLET